MTNKNQNTLNWDQFKSLASEEVKNEPEIIQEDNDQSMHINYSSKVRILIDKKKRRGKEVTLVQGIDAHAEHMKRLSKMLKSKCGVGGSLKDREILIQGNHREKVLGLLQKEGFKDVKFSGS